MKPGFVSAMFPELSLVEMLSLAAPARFACAEIMCRPFGNAERNWAGVKLA